MGLHYCISFNNDNDFRIAISKLSYLECEIDDHNLILKFDIESNRDFFINLLEDIETEIFEVKTLMLM